MIWRCCLLLLFSAVLATAARADCGAMENQGTPYTVCRFDPGRDELRIFASDPAGQPFRGFDRLSRFLWQDRHVLSFATNGGMYRDDLSPVGLYVEYGREMRAASTASGWGNFHMLPNGIFAIGSGKARVMETNAYLQSGFHADFATQSGPMLVIGGQIHPRFLPDSDSLKIRNGVGVDAKGLVHFAITERPVRFHDFATFFRDVLGCADALYLDGSISSAYIPAMGRNDRLFPLGTIIGVVERLPD